jgi:hypothetical protein
LLAPLAGTVSEAIVAGDADAVNVTLDGIVAQIVLAFAAAAPVEGTAAAILLTAMARDADGNTIVGPSNYDNPIRTAW